MITMFNFWKGLFKPSTLYGIRATGNPTKADHIASSFTRSMSIDFIKQRKQEGYTKFKIMEGIGICPQP